MLERCDTTRREPFDWYDTAPTPPSRDFRADPPGPAQPLDDTTLAARAAEGDLGALGVLLGRYQRPMYRLALRMLGDRGDAEDAVQEAFVSAWRQLGGYRGESAFGTWLYRIVANRCLNAARARGRRPSTPTVDIEGLAATAGPEDLAVAADLRRRLDAALAGLAPLARLCWVLREGDGLGYEEIAAIVGLTPTAVRGRIHRARQALSAAVEEWR